LDAADEKGTHNIKGGKTIFGRIISYQEKTGMSIEGIMRMPYITFVLGMLDAPSIDFDEKTTKEVIPDTANSQVNSLVSFLQ
jgi:hypothetical protein